MNLQEMTKDELVACALDLQRALTECSNNQAKLREAEKALRESEEKYRNLFNNAEVGMFRTRLDGSEILDMNERFLKIFGWTRAEMRGKPSVIHWADPHERAEMFRKLNIDCRVTDFECKMLNKQGEELTCITSLRLYREQGVLEGSITDVTERRKAEEALRESEQRYRAVVDNIEVGISLRDSDMQIVEVNKALKRYFPDVRPACGQICYEQYNDSPRPEACSYCPCVLTLQDGNVHEAITETPTGSEVRYYHLVSSPIKDSHGGVQYVIELTEDITERKRAEELLQQAERRYRRLFEFAPLMAVITRNDRGVPLISDCNELFLRCVGYSRDEVVGLPLANFYSLKSGAELLQGGGYARAMAGEFFIGERQLLRRDGTLIPTLLYTAPELNPSGDVIGTCAMFVDITNRKKAEEALRRSEEQYRLLVEMAPDAIVVSEDGLISYVNKAATQLLGATDPGEIVGTRPVEWVYSDDRALVEHRMQVLLASETLIPPSAWRLVRQDGAVRDVEAVSGSLRFGDSMIIHAVLRDITDRKAFELQVAEANELRERIISESPMGIAVYRADGQCISANDALGRIVGAGKDHLVTQNFRNLSSWEVSGLLADAEQVLCGGVNNQREVKLTSTFGRTVWVNARMARLTSGGEPLLLLVFNDITERRVAEDQLKFEREQLLSIFESISEVILVIDPRTYEILYANKFTEDLYGKQLTGGNCYEKLSGLTTPCGRCINEKIVELQGEPYQWEYSSPILKRDFLATDRMVRWPDGRDVKFHLAIDITDRKRAEEALQSASDYNRSLIEASLDPLVTISAHGKITDVNRATERVTGYSRDELIGTDFADYFTDPQKARDGYQRAFNKGIVKDYELEIRHRGGHLIPVMYNVSVYHDRSGDIVGLFAAARDISRSKQAEEKNLRLAAIVESSDDAIIGKSLDGIITSWNRGAANIYGYKEDEVVGKPVSLLVPPERHDELSRLLERAKQGEHVEHHETVRRKKDGRDIDVSLTISPIRNPEGRITGASTIARDITEQTSLQRQLLQAQKMEAIGTLAGGVAHDFNNVLQVVLGYSELLLEEEGVPQRHKADVLKINESARRGADLVQRLLTFSRKMEIKPQPLNLNRRVTELRKMLERTIPKMIDIQLLLSADLATINADPTQIDQILMNLAVNARDAMPEGGNLIVETANILIDAEYARTHVEAKPGHHVLLTVTDTGMGMDKATLEHIFEPFYTTKSVGEGTGLGLAMVHGIVQQHGGHVRCYSEPGQGTTFKVYFPALISDEEQEETAARRMPRGGSETVLLVDDEKMIRDLGSRILSKSGYKVIAASNGKEALDVYEQRGGEIALRRPRSYHARDGWAKMP